jgi:hypothetical protein
MPSEKIGLPPEVAAALEHVRGGGRTNMRDVPQVLALLMADEALGAADWVETHQVEHAQGVSRGFIIVEAD